MTLLDEIDAIDEVMDEFHPGFILITQLLAAKEVTQSESGCLETSCGDWFLAYNATSGVATDSRGSKVWPWLILAYKGTESEPRVAIGALETDLPVEDDEVEFLKSVQTEFNKYLS